MILPNPKEAVHKAWLYRLLTYIYNDVELTRGLFFKGGTCAAMLGYLDRFSVDLDFDCVAGDDNLIVTRKKMEAIFKDLNLEIKDKSKKVPQYFLKYQADAGMRNTIKVDVTCPPAKNNQYQSVRLVDIDRIATCQTVETMFANKLVALIDRFERNGSIAGRDVYDIHYFFLKGFGYTGTVIEERRNQEVKVFLKELVDFIENKITETIISQDLNFLLPYDKFKKIRKVLKNEVLVFLRDEIRRLA